MLIGTYVKSFRTVTRNAVNKSVRRKKNLFLTTLKETCNEYLNQNISRCKLAFPLLQLRCALILRELNQIFIASLFKGSQEQSFFLQTLLFTAFLVTVLKMLTYALVST